MIVDLIHTLAETITDRELVPLSGDVGRDGERVALFMEAEDVLDTCLVGP